MAKPITDGDTPYGDAFKEFYRSVRGEIEEALTSQRARCTDNDDDRKALADAIMAQLNPLLVSIAGVRTLMEMICNDSFISRAVIEDGFMLPGSHEELEELRNSRE